MSGDCIACGVGQATCNLGKQSSMNGFKACCGECDHISPTVPLEILYCPKHRIYGIGLNGTRITPTKCCGSWDVPREWKKIPVDDIRKALR